MTMPGEAREWAEHTRYLYDEVMTYQGQRYICTLAGITGTWPPLVINGSVLNGSARFVPEDPQ